MLGSCYASTITCSSYEILVSNGIEMDPVTCEDDNSPHIPLSVDSLPKGVVFNGKTFSGVPNDTGGRRGVIVYNGDTAVLVVFLCTVAVRALIF